jgi:hypothetical protein
MSRNSQLTTNDRRRSNNLMRWRSGFANWVSIDVYVALVLVSSGCLAIEDPSSAVGPEIDASLQEVTDDADDATCVTSCITDPDLATESACRDSRNDAYKTRFLIKERRVGT